MYSVTERIRNIKQPWGGYIKRKNFSVTELSDKKELNQEENIHPSLIGLTVDYLTRFVMGSAPADAFKISLMGASVIAEDKKATTLLKKIKGLDKDSIYNACKLVGYDVCFRAGKAAYKPVDEINADTNTIENIAIMVRRSVVFWKEYGPIIKDGFTFEGGYTPIISTGDGDYLTQDTLWDFKVSKEEPRSKYTLQLLVYYLMGSHSIHKEFENIKKLGIFNPRKNKVYLLPISSIPQSVIDDVSYTVIGYGITRDKYKEFLEDEFQKKEMNERSKKMPIDSQLCLFDQKQNLKSKTAIRKKKELECGDSITHIKFGKGIIIDIQEIGKMKFAIVNFDTGEQKKIMLSYLSKV